MTDIRAGAHEVPSEGVVIAVPDDAVEELIESGLANEAPTLRGPFLDTALMVGVDSAAVVTLMQAPTTVAAFAAWLSERVRRRRDSLRIQGRRNGREIELEVTGDVPVDAVKNFLEAALGDIHDGPRRVE